ncbi:hypothetical protein [Vibrio coralliilyticus]|uniref:hypothetical protein n=1 Tax=Vibrio coralliilyticus TaxID=190893 RepID=UPI0020B6C70D|nr:hypothetical protein [Vibrio coralliilyticus]
MLSCTLCCFPIIAQANDNIPIDLEGEYYAFGAVVDTVQPHASRASAAGMARMSVQWAATPNGRFALTLDHRHGFTNPPPGHWLPQSTGIMSLTGAPFSDQGWRLTHGYWEQTGLSDRWHAMVGYLDSTDFIDLYPYGSPYSGFSNVQFSTGSGTIVLPDEASIGGMIHHQMGAHYYLQLNVSDARADSSHPWQRAEAVFRERRTFEAVELGWVAEPSQALAQQLHVTGWRFGTTTVSRRPQCVLERNFGRLDSFFKRWGGSGIAGVVFLIVGCRNRLSRDWPWYHGYGIRPSHIKPRWSFNS